MGFGTQIGIIQQRGEELGVQGAWRQQEGPHPAPARAVPCLPRRQGLLLKVLGLFQLPSCFRGPLSKKNNKEIKTGKASLELSAAALLHGNGDGEVQGAVSNQGAATRGQHSPLCPCSSCPFQHQAAEETKKNNQEANNHPPSRAERRLHPARG